MPHTTAVSPRRTTALPLAWVKEPVWRVGGRNSFRRRVFGRVMTGTGVVDGDEVVVVDWRWARRKGPGDSFAKVALGKERIGEVSVLLVGRRLAIAVVSQAWVVSQSSIES